MHPLARTLPTLLLAGCVVSQTDLTEISSMGPITFSGYTEAPGDVVRVRAYNRAREIWETIAQATSASTPDVPPHVWGGNPALYSWSVTAPISTLNDPYGSCFLDPRCVPRVDHVGTSSVRLVFEVGSQSSPIRAAVYDPNGLDCIAARVQAGQAFNNAAYDCRSPSYPELNLRYSDWWLPLLQPQPPGRVSLEPGGGGAYVYAVEGSAVLWTGGSSVDWLAWQARPPSPEPLVNDEAPAGGFAVTQAGHLVRDGIVLPVNGVRGHLSAVREASIDPLLRQIWLSYAKLGGGVELTILRDRTGPVSFDFDLLRTESFPGDDVAMGGIEPYQPDWSNAGPSGGVLAVRAGGDLRFYRVSPAAPLAGPTAFLGSYPANATGWISAPVVQFGQVHLLYLAPLGAGTQLMHASFALEQPFSVTARVVHSWPGAAPSRPTLVKLGTNLVTGWAEGTRFGFARWAPSGSLGSWEEDAIDGVVPLDGTVAIVNHYAFDAQAIVRGVDGALRSVAFTRIQTRRQVERELDLYTANYSSGCAGTPVPVRDATQLPAEVVTDIGRALWRLPAGFTGPLLRQLGQRGCAARGSLTPGRACELAKTSVVLSPTTSSYTCGDTVYLPSAPPHQETTRSPATKELARAIARALGMNDSGAPPASWNAAASGLSLSTLQAGNALFATPGGCTAGVGCPGFATNLSYERSGREEAFSVVLNAYVDDAAALRTTAARYRARVPCNDLLARKYAWIRANIFRGVEMRDPGDVSPEVAFCP